ncbi:hypothetical protein DOTSEDRAFT_83952 [Dothistroma septosporum NZE10]|uniref:Uncharacterized protein n=1 Tax=Dothistroma septosporum (strain NZE10 / CBS 128990) TaxID=675120 RepID=M2YHY8_DOTSN|nr:hypothetical protein DOTSEDRAFT_83952 [Dothistroma septosporum NZE10]
MADHRTHLPLYAHYVRGCKPRLTLTNGRQQAMTKTREVKSLASYCICSQHTRRIHLSSVTSAQRHGCHVQSYPQISSVLSGSQVIRSQHCVSRRCRKFFECLSAVSTYSDTVLATAAYSNDLPSNLQSSQYGASRSRESCKVVPFITCPLANSRDPSPSSKSASRASAEQSQVRAMNPSLPNSQARRSCRSQHETSAAKKHAGETVRGNRRPDLCIGDNAMQHKRRPRGAKIGHREC